jgi:hypothetical protein
MLHNNNTITTTAITNDSKEMKIVSSSIMNSDYSQCETVHLFTHLTSIGQSIMDHIASKKDDIESKFCVKF